MNISKALEEYGLTLYNSEAADSSASCGAFTDDASELLLPDLFEAAVNSGIGKEIDETIENVPIIGNLTSAVKAAGTFRDMVLLHKWLIFQEQFREGTVSPEKLQKWKDAARNHEKWIKREIELLLVCIDNISEKRNVEILCNVYLEYLNGECTEDQFHEAAVLLERFVSYDEEQLKGFYDLYLHEQNAKPNSVSSVFSTPPHCDRLVALGLLWVEYSSMPGSAQPLYHITEIGVVLGKAMK